MSSRGRRGGRRALAVACVLATCTGVAGAARADPLGEAKELFARGRQLRKEGDCAAALRLFHEAYQVYPAGLGSLRNTAECEESLGHFASARRAWLDLDRALARTNEKKYEGWTHDAEQAAARLAPKVATLTIEAKAATPSGAPVSPEGIELTVNGERLAPVLTGVPLERDPGRYVVRASAPGMAPREISVDLSPGESRHVVLGVVVPPEPDPARDKASAHVAPGRVAAWTAIGFGAAAFAGAGVSWLVRQSALDDLSGDDCSSAPNGSLACPTAARTAAESAESRGQTATTLIDVFAVAGAVGVATGLVLLATTPSRTPPSAALVISPTGVSAFGRF